MDSGHVDKVDRESSGAPVDLQPAFFELNHGPLLFFHGVERMAQPIPPRARLLEKFDQPLWRFDDDEHIDAEADGHFHSAIRIQSKHGKT